MTALFGSCTPRARRRRAVVAALALGGLGSAGVVVAPTSASAGQSLAPQVSSSSMVGVQRGDTGPAVQAVQRQLTGFGYVVGVDGVFGPATERAVRHFQRSNNLEPSGVVTQATASYLALSPADTTTTPASPAAERRTSSAAATAVAAAMTQRGAAYRYGMAKPGVGFDCSGLTAWAWARAGVSLPFQSALQYATIPHVSVAEARPGDLVFFHTPISHVAMYLGNNRIIDAMQPGSGVIVRTVRWSAVVGVGRPG